MRYELDKIEERVLGSLIEKSITTPDYYPLTLNALTAACNQKSNRDPVLELDEKIVVRALDSLREKELTRVVSGADIRVPKYYHRFDESEDLSPAQVAILCELMLRGPQTVGELRGRANRMFEFPDLSAVETVLGDLTERAADRAVTQLPRQPGRKESRYAHLFAGEPGLTDAVRADEGRASPSRLKTSVWTASSPPSRSCETKWHKYARNSKPSSNNSSSEFPPIPIGTYLSQLGWLDLRSLACFRVLLALVLLYDISQSWSTIDDWAGLQGYYDGLPLPHWIGLSDETTLYLIFGLYAVCTVGFLFGYRTSWCTLAVWLVSCGHQYAARNTLDYHDAVIVNLLLWSLVLPTGQRFSVDAVLAPSAYSPRRTPVQVVAACGFVLTLVWLYLNTAAFKDGAAWWSEGSAVRLALMDFSGRSPTGVWALAHLPEAFFRTATHVVMAVEWVIPLLLLSPWKRSLLRTVSVLALAGMHGAMWLFMDIGSFPPVMMAAATALLPAAFWNQVIERVCVRGVRPAIERTEERAQGVASLACCGRVKQYLLTGFFGLCLLINIEGNRLRALDADLRTTYPGASWVLKLKYMLGVESSWAMYAPEPARYGGWWVAFGHRHDGSAIDPITGEPPTLEVPFPRKGAHAGLRGHYWSQAPYEHGPQHSYL